jgi:hypothetical protein
MPYHHMNLSAEEPPPPVVRALEEEQRCLEARERVSVSEVAAPTPTRWPTRMQEAGPSTMDDVWAETPLRGNAHDFSRG